MLKQNAVFTDEELMDRTRNGDRKCFEELYNRYYKRLFNFIFLFINDREKAEDILHDVFIKVMESHDRFDLTLKFSTWIYTIAVNQCRNDLRNHLTRKHLLALNFIPDSISSTDQTESIDKRSFKLELNKIMNEMDDENKTIILLRFHE
ncbi:MAG: sigma-70 family RNA polymerase sigma factor, partial [Sphingobacteriales bacterium]